MDNYVLSLLIRLEAIIRQLEGEIARLQTELNKTSKSVEGGDEQPVQ